MGNNASATETIDGSCDKALLEQDPPTEYFEKFTQSLELVVGRYETAIELLKTIDGNENNIKTLETKIARLKTSMTNLKVHLAQSMKIC